MEVAGRVLTYVEVEPPPELAKGVLCLWTHATDVRAHGYRHRVLPDGCVDIVWIGDRPAIVAGPATRETSVSLPAGRRTIGVRLRPGWAASLLGLSAEELLNLDAPLTDVWGASARGLAEQAGGRGSVEQRLAQLARMLAKRFAAAREPHPAILHAVSLLGRDASTRVQEVAKSTGLSPRHLQRRFSEAVGYGPKTFQRVVRLQRLLSLGAGEASDLSLAAGYADQAHMCREVSALAGCTPARLIGTGTTLAMSDFFNTTAAPARTLGSSFSRRQRNHETAHHAAHPGG
jgi:AraC-like DNA-binding protein